MKRFNPARADILITNQKLGQSDLIY